MCRSGKNTPQNNPQKGCCSEKGSHNRSVNRSETGNIQYLDKKNPPGFEGNKVHTVLLGKGRCFPFGINSKNLFYNFTINEITGYKHNQTNHETEHNDSLIKSCCHSAQEELVCVVKKNEW